MFLRYIARSAARSQSTRERIRREGRTCRGDPLWTKEEDAELRRLHPDYLALRKSLPRRTISALKHRAIRIGLAKQHHFWTAVEVSRLRRLYPTSTIDELKAAFPGLRSKQINDRAKKLHLRKKRRPYPSTGFPVIDQIRARAFELNLTMEDVDKMAGTRHFFQNGRWRGCRSVNGSAVFLAISALDGDVRAIWRDE
jgi:hypothetical protein